MPVVLQQQLKFYWGYRAMKKLLLSFIFLILAVPVYAGFQEVPVNQPFLYKFVSGSTATTVKTGSGILHTLTVTGGTTSTIDIYDGTPIAATLMYSFTTTNALQTYTFDVAFNSGCTVITSSGLLKYTASYL